MRAICIFCTLLMAGCASTKAPAPKVTVKGDTYCRVAKPITYSKSDTMPTVSQIRRHNNVYAKSC